MIPNVGTTRVLDEFLKDYLLECQEGLAQIEANLLALEREPDSRPLLASIFRVVHSIKGASGFLGFAKMAAVTHDGEELLGKLRDGEVRTTPEVISSLLALVDAMRSILGSIEATKAEGERDDSALIARLRDLQHGSGGGPPAPEPAPPVPEPTGPSIAEPTPPPPEAEARTKPATRARKPRRTEEPTSAKPVEPSATSPPPAPEPPEPAAAGSLLSESTIRVDVGLLDKLMNLVGELVLTRNQFLRGSLAGDEAAFQAATQRLDAITTELQEGMMKTRMQPIRTLTAPLPRVVRDLSLACGKRATLTMEGEETELDKTLSEAIKDPITHIIRNAVDHGIEAPEVRASRGKPPEGRLRLRAYHEGGMVHIEVSDDGNGIDPERIRRKAVERSWLAEDQAARWSDRELIGMIFRPGFSTADAPTMVSGRGVGMDVVKNRVESIGGSVDASSKPGEGTTIKLTIPLTLTIINALVVRAGGDRFAIPQVNLIELIRLKGEAAARGLIEVQGAPVYRYRGRLLPLIDLDETLGFALGAGRREDDGVNIVVLQADRRRFGLVVDRIDDAQEIVVRPLARQLKGIACLAGATVMGDGKVALILDVFGLARGLDARREADLAAASLAAETPSGNSVDEAQALVLLRGTDDGPMAIPLSQVERLETFPAASVEWVADRPVVAYRQALVPLIDVAAWLRGSSWLGGRDGGGPSRLWQVVVHAHEGKRLGLVFGQVLDIVEHRLDVRGEAKRPGVLFTAVVQGRATEILDVAAIRAAVAPAGRGD
jgi:two-component system chemotaxis sensor kinase CheA